MKCLCIVALISVLAGQQSGAQTVSAEQEVLKVENDWNQTLVKRDTVSLPRFYADEYLYTNPDGLVWDRTQDSRQSDFGFCRSALNIQAR